MRILVIGGTRFVGRHIAAAVLERGHEVTLLHRTATDLFPGAEHVLTDRDGDLAALSGREWDATIDVSAYRPRQVRAIADALGGRGGRYLLISSTSVYSRPDSAGFDESSPTVPPAAPDVEEITETSYGPLKVACELLARETFGARATIVRPTYVIGPWDYTRRFTSWVERVSAGGEVLGPGNPADPLQVIDARDLGAFVAGLVESDAAGTFHAVTPTPPYTFGDLLRDLVAVIGPPGTTVTWVDQQWLLDQGESDATIPLWGGGDPWIEANAADPAAAHVAGLHARLVRQSIREIADHLSANPPVGASPGLAAQREAELLAAWHARD
jgi:2'-hydroxyisoflavone reductase